MVFAELGETMSGGNFHGEYPAKVCTCVCFSDYKESCKLYYLLSRWHKGDLFEYVNISYTLQCFNN